MAKRTIKGSVKGSSSVIPLKRYPDLMFGLTGAIGTDLESVTASLTSALNEVGYTVIPVRFSELMLELKGKPWEALPDRKGRNYYEKYMTAGNTLRERLQRGDALGLLAMGFIQKSRKNARLKNPSIRLAFILHSFKRSEELQLFRRVYGPTFVSIAAYASRSKRVERLARSLAERHSSNKAVLYRHVAETLVQRDESEGRELGQNLRKAFPLSDFFVSVTNPEKLDSKIRRFVHLIFGHPWHTPSRDEQAMAVAQLASWRSASPARQVGASITTKSGSLISIGTNDIATVAGGLYWEGDEPDGRDFQTLRRDTSDQMKENVITDLVERLKDKKLLVENCPTPAELLYGKSNIFRDAQVLSTIDFVRAVHAEMNAMFEAKERGARLDDAVLYTTTFPCHDCAKHIVTSGIRRVVYIEPYPKSLVAELFSDSIAVDSDSHGEDRVQFEAFEGIAPRKYYDLFSLRTRSRKSEDGSFVTWDSSKAFPQTSEQFSQLLAHTAETDAFGEFLSLREKAGI